MLVQFGVTLILARILTPTEIGVFSITSVFVTIISAFRDFGISAYLLQEKDLTTEKKKTALGLLILSAWSFAAIIFFSSGYISSYYALPGIQDILHVSTIVWLLLPFSSYFYCLQAREHEAGKQAIVNGVGTIVYAATAIVLALYGFSYMSMVWASVANNTAGIFLYLSLRDPSTPLAPSLKNWQRTAKFGTGALFGDLVISINTTIPDLVLGKVGGAHPVGLYSRASGLVGLFYQVVGPTITYNALPYVAKNYHANVDLIPIFTKATAYLTVLSWPFFLLVGFFSTEIISVLYGAKWVEAAPIVIFLCAQWTMSVGYSLCYPAFMAIGRPYLAAVWTVTSIFTRLFFVFVLNANDVITFAIALTIADLCTISLPVLLMSRYFGYTAKASAVAHWASLKVILFCIPATVAFSFLTPTLVPDFLKLILVSISVILSWLFAVLLTRHPIINEFSNAINKLLPLNLATRIIYRLKLPL